MKVMLLAWLSLLVVAHAEAGGKEVDYQIDGKPYRGYYLSPGDKAPLVVLIHDWDGLTEYEIRRSQMLAALGYAVFAADLFGKGIRPTELAEKQKLTGALYADRQRMRALMRGALRAAAQQGGNTRNAVAMGYCFGGTAVLEWARSGDPLKGFVSFHGGLETPEGQDYASATAPLLVLHGTADKLITMRAFATLAEELEKQGVTHEMITYSGAPHAFSVFGSDRYREDADKKSWSRFTGFLGEILGNTTSTATP